MEFDKSKLCFGPATINDYEEVMGLAWRTFLQFEADVYTKEGIQNFQDFITDENLRKMFIKNRYQIFIAKYRDEIVGMIGLRDGNHISLLFVDANFHYLGIGKQLVQILIGYVEKTGEKCCITVNASPYGVGFYHRIGFKDTASEQSKDGIIYTPMGLIL